MHVDYTHVHNVAHYKIIRTCHILFLQLTAPMQGKLRLLQGLGDIAEENNINQTADILE